MADAGPRRKDEDRPSVLNVLAQPFVKIVDRWMPDPFIFAILLTILTYILAVTVAGYGPVESVEAWGNGLWDLLAFTTQIAMTLVTGYALANTPLVQKIIAAATGRIKSAGAAYAIVTIVAALASLISWGMGLIVGALMARETAIACKRRGLKVHYPLLVASGYAGFVLWHQGLSSSTALVIAGEDHFLADRMGVIPITETILTSTNLLIILSVLLTLPVLMMLMRPAERDVIEFAQEETAEAPPEPRDTPADRIGHSRVLNIVIGAAAVFYLLWTLFAAGGSVDLNFINMSFLTAGILLTTSPAHYVRLITEGGRTLGPIIIQYPFYAGIMGLMMASGLAAMLSNSLASFASADTLPFWAFLSGGIVNIFVPSGGGQWAVQGPVMIEASRALDADLARVALGVAIGDQWTNMIQPFWTIPALAIAGLQVRHIMGYCVLALIWTGIIFSAGLLLF
ncbi:TIGR00366 family protein [Roseivivax marinus]|uniref:short-chain fatty acid transporter n=1 Tax=Roseivivax marinus TaxID=1379903 RepID=UPI001F043554|nr:TIGR00366 family protein [Roseivivax marinus]UMA66212.1 TIGR00366 family protein [Roseivivax marinus]